jgi:hypothetical protein
LLHMHYSQPRMYYSKPQHIRLHDPKESNLLQFLHLFRSIQGSNRCCKCIFQ